MELVQHPMQVERLLRPEGVVAGQDDLFQLSFLDLLDRRGHGFEPEVIGQGGAGEAGPVGFAPPIDADGASPHSSASGP